MGMCKPSGGIKPMMGKIGDLPRIGTPNTRTDLYNEQGELIQQRWYGPDGRAIWNRDWKHKITILKNHTNFHMTILGTGIKKFQD